MDGGDDCDRHLGDHRRCIRLVASQSSGQSEPIGGVTK